MSDRVLVIIDDPFELSSVGAALRMHGVEVVAEARKKSTAINLFRSLQPNVLLIDMHKSQEHSVDIAHVIRKEAAGIGVVILVPCADMRLIGEDLAQMPAGTLLVLKDALSNLTALCDVISASRVFEADQKIVWVNGGITLTDKQSHGLMSSLSDIQIQTLRYAADGLTNAEIGRLRFVSEKAIEQVLSRVAIALNIQPDHRKNMRVQLVNEFQIRSRWNDVLDTLESHNRIAWIAYFDARLISVEDGLLTLDFSDSRKFATSHEYSETRPNLKAALISAIHEVLGLTVDIREQ